MIGYKTHAEMIRGVVEELGSATPRAIIDLIKAKYPEIAVKETSFRADIIGCSMNHTSSHHYPGMPKFLFYERKKGTYRLYDPEKEGKGVVDDKGAHMVGGEPNEDIESEEISTIVIDSERGKKVAEFLYNSFSTVGIHGKTEMPEDITPNGVKRGSLEHILFITLTVSIDYQRDAPALWESSRKTFADPETRYLFNPKLLHETPFRKIVEDMQKYKLSKKPQKDAKIWRTVSVTLYKKWEGDPRNFLKNCNWDSSLILSRLREDTRLYNGRLVSDYPYLRGPKIGPLWLRMLRDNVDISQLRNLEKVPIPVDIHVARATLTTGVVRGSIDIRLDELFEYIRKAWFESVEGLSIKDRPMIALDVDEPLWHLSKYGCTKRNKTTSYCPYYSKCEARDFCIEGIVKIENGVVELET
jgi:hypothetical protein